MQGSHSGVAASVVKRPEYRYVFIPGTDPEDAGISILEHDCNYVAVETLQCSIKQISLLHLGLV